jgi:hypothetical protein
VTAVPGAVPRALSWPAAFGRAALVLWLPALLPLAVGPLGGCGHCTRTYSAILPIVPAVVVPALAGAEGVWFGVAGGVATAAVFGTLATALRELTGRGRRWLARGASAVVALVIAAEALAFATALRA